MKNFYKPMLDYLSVEEIHAIIAAPDQKTWSSYLGFIMFNIFYSTRARNSEIINLKIRDVLLEKNKKSIRIDGKGRKERIISLWTNMAKLLREYMQVRCHFRIAAFP